MDTPTHEGSEPVPVTDPQPAPTWPHRVVGGSEANQMDRIHGCCVVCLVPWPCPTQLVYDEAVLSSVDADMEAWHQRMKALGWAVR